MTFTEFVLGIGQIAVAVVLICLIAVVVTATVISIEKQWKARNK